MFTNDNIHLFIRTFNINFEELEPKLKQLRIDFDSEHENQLVVLQKLKILFDFTYKNLLKRLVKLCLLLNDSGEQNENKLN